VALALSLPPGGIRDTLLTVTYIAVAFSIIVQGLTVGPLVKFAKQKITSINVISVKVFYHDITHGRCPLTQLMLTTPHPIFLLFDKE